MSFPREDNDSDSSVNDGDGNGFAEFLQLLSYHDASAPAAAEDDRNFSQSRCDLCSLIITIVLLVTFTMLS